MLLTKVRIGTWNLRTLHEARNINNAVREMLSLIIDILGMAEIRWPENRISHKTMQLCTTPENPPKTYVTDMELTSLYETV